MYIDSHQFDVIENTIEFVFFNNFEHKTYFKIVCDVQELEDFIAEDDSDVVLIPQTDTVYVKEDGKMVEDYSISEAIGLKILNIEGFIKQNL
jgi:ribonuclease PH